MPFLALLGRAPATLSLLWALSALLLAGGGALAVDVTPGGLPASQVVAGLLPQNSPHILRFLAGRHAPDSQVVDLRGAGAWDLTVEFAPGAYIDGTDAPNSGNGLYFLGDQAQRDSNVTVRGLTAVNVSNAVGGALRASYLHYFGLFDSRISNCASDYGGGLDINQVARAQVCVCLFLVFYLLSLFPPLPHYSC
jgi:hypothetical protein